MSIPVTDPSLICLPVTKAADVALATGRVTRTANATIAIQATRRAPWCGAAPMTRRLPVPSVPLLGFMALCLLRDRYLVAGCRYRAMGPHGRCKSSDRCALHPHVDADLAA